MKKAKLSKEELSRVRSLAGSVVTAKKSDAVRKNLAKANKVKADIFRRYKNENTSSD